VRRSRPSPPAPAHAPAPDADAAVTLRFAVFDDAPDLFGLGQLDSAAPLAEPILVAEVSGRLTAALSLAHDRVIADPFVLLAGVMQVVVAEQPSNDTRPQRQPESAFESGSSRRSSASYPRRRGPPQRAAA
jgi:hypothetical protein